jgi:hypothetical protein
MFIPGYHENDRYIELALQIFEISEVLWALEYPLPQLFR